MKNSKKFYGGGKVRSPKSKALAMISPEAVKELEDSPTALLDVLKRALKGCES